MNLFLLSTLLLRSITSLRAARSNSVCGTSLCNSDRCRSASEESHLSALLSAFRSLATSLSLCMDRQEAHNVLIAFACWGFRRPVGIRWPRCRALRLGWMLSDGAFRGLGTISLALRSGDFLPRRTWRRHRETARVA